MLTAILITILGTTNPTPIVMIDPGHGGELDGAVGVCGLKEKDVTLAVSIETAKIINASGNVRALLTRNTDEGLELENRSALANRSDASLFVSVHANASLSSKSHGIETYFLSNRASNKRSLQLAKRENEGQSFRDARTSANLTFILGELQSNAAHRASQRFAGEIQKGLAKRLKARDRGVLQAPFVVLRDATMATILVEVGFLSHPEECKKLAQVEYQRTISEGLAASILYYFAEHMVAGRAPFAHAHGKNPGK